MKTKIISAISLLLLTLNSVGLVQAGPRPKKVKASQTSQLVARLPESDAVAVIDSRRFFDDALPKILASKPSLLNKITSALGDIERKTSVDLRKFDQLAIGVQINKTGEKQFDCDPVMIARGTLNVGALISVAKMASKGAYREEKVGERSIYIFSAKEIADKNAKKSPKGTITDTLEQTADKLSREIAVGSFDSNTMVVGSPARVRQTFEGKTSVSADITSLLARRERAVFSFAARTPEGMAGLVPVENDELGNNLKSIRYIAGWVDVAAGNATATLLARTVNAEKAQGLFDTVEGLRMVGKAFLSGSKKPENKVLSRMVENAKVAKAGNDVTIDVAVPQGDIDILLASIH